MPCHLAKHKNVKAVLVGLFSKAWQHKTLKEDMKRYGNLFEKITNLDNILLAHKRARRDKSHYKEVKMVDKNPEFYARQIKNELENESYKVGEYKYSRINDKGKERELMKLPYYPDRIIQWAIMLQVEPIFIKQMIDQTCASIPSRGIHSAYHFIQKYVEDKNESKYCLKLDIRHFYQSIDQNILKGMLKGIFKDQKLLRLLFKIVDSYPENKGIPIGSYLSQYLGNIYLKELDHFIKENLHCKRYVRYMDDMVILGSSKEQLHIIRHEIEKYLNQNLHLELKNNYQIFPTFTRGIDFVGYRFFGEYTLLRKGTCKRFKKAMRKLTDKKELDFRDRCTFYSYKGWLDYCDSYRLKSKYMGGLHEKIKECTG